MGVVTQRGQFRYKRLTFGVTDGPFYFQYVMDTLVRDLPGVDVFLDDITVQGDTWEQVWARTLRVLERLVGAGFLINLRKCRFLVTEFNLLGHRVSNRSVQLGDKFIAGWANVSIPRSIPDLQALLGRFAWAAPFIPSYKELVRPLE